MMNIIKFKLKQKFKLLIIYQPQFSRQIELQLNEKYQAKMFSDTLDKLYQGISTDGILPSEGGQFQKEKDLARFALSGIPGIPKNSLKNRKINVIIVGDKFGCGSAREHAARALKGTGIELIIVIGKAERIFKENCLNSGGPFILELNHNINGINYILDSLSKFGKIKVGNPFENEIEFLIYKSRGLFAFTKKILSHKINLPQINHAELPSNHPMTASEKIIARHFININKNNLFVIPGDTGFVRTHLRFSYEFMTKMLVDLLEDNFPKEIDKIIKNKKSIALFEDHLVWASDNPHFSNLIKNQRDIAIKHELKIFHQDKDKKGSRGVCHTLITEEGLLLPGQIGFGTDSHTCSAGVLGAFAFGGGVTAMANAFITETTLLKVPETIKINIHGKLNKYCFAKDVMLYLLANSYVKSGKAIGKVLEFTGVGLANWPFDQLFVLTNMSVEAGATTGIIPEATPAVINKLITATKLSENEIRKMFINSDINANFTHTIDINLDEIIPMIATPGHPTNGVPLVQLKRTGINSGYIGSCTGGNLTDLYEAAKILKGKYVKTPLTIQPSSMSVYLEALSSGLIDMFINSGVNVIYPGCGACIGLGPGKALVDSDIIISNTNRNFPGRMGGKARVYLANSAVVAQSCLKGHIAMPGL